MSETTPTIFSRDELRDLIREVLDERQELVGLPASSSAERQALREDAVFVRRLRRMIDGAATKVGYAILMAIVAGVVGIAVAGVNAKIGR